LSSNKAAVNKFPVPKLQTLSERMKRYHIPLDKSDNKISYPSPNLLVKDKPPYILTQTNNNKEDEKKNIEDKKSVTVRTNLLSNITS
jgi:hypothetical protein